MTKRTLYDFKSIIQMADAEIVAESLGLEVRTRGRTKSILCPLHDDHHFGSCQLFETGFHCYVCDVTHDTISMVKDVLNCNAKQAAEYILNLYGKSTNKYKQETISKINKPILDNKKLQLIGLAPAKPTEENRYLNSPTVYKVVSISENIEDFEEYYGKSKYKIEYEPFNILNKGAKLDGVYALKEMIIKNPLQELANSDEVAYKDLIYTKAKEAKEKYESIISSLFSKNAYNKKIDDYLTGKIETDDVDYGAILDRARCYVYKNLLKEATTGELTEILTKKVRECEDLIIEFSPYNSENKQKRKVFSKIVTNSVSF